MTSVLSVSEPPGAWRQLGLMSDITAATTTSGFKLPGLGEIGRS
jgi:hypothetical protein